MLACITEVSSDLCDVVAIAHSPPKPPDHASSVCDIVCMPDFPAIDRLLRKMLSPAASYLPDPSQPSMSAESGSSGASIFDLAPVSAARPVWPGQGGAKEATPCTMDTSVCVAPLKPHGQLSSSSPPPNLPIPSLSTHSEATENSQPACDIVACLHARQQQTLKVAHLQRQLGENFTQEAEKTDSQAALLAKDAENKALEARILDLDRLYNDVGVELSEAEEKGKTLKENLARADKALEDETKRLEEDKKVLNEELEQERDRRESITILLQARVTEEEEGREADRVTRSTGLALLQEDLTKEKELAESLQAEIDRRVTREEELRDELKDRHRAIQHQKDRNKDMAEENTRLRELCTGRDAELRDHLAHLDKSRQEVRIQQIEITDLETKSGQMEQNLKAKAVLLQEKDVENSKLGQTVAILTRDQHELKMIVGRFTPSLKGFTTDLIGFTNICENVSNIFTKREESTSLKESVDDKMTRTEAEPRGIIRRRALEPGEVEETSRKKPRLDA